jgi:hypothetical protein
MEIELVDGGSEPSTDTDTETDAEPVEAAEPAAPERNEVRTADDRPSRKERRAAKGMDFKAELKARDEQIALERNERSRLEREFAELRGRFAERAESTPKKDPYADQIAELEKAAKADLKAAAAAMEKNPAEAERLVDEHNKKMREITLLAVEQRQQAKQAEAQKNAPQPLSPQEYSDGERVVQEFPWITSNTQARVIVDDLIARMTASGQPRNYTTFKAAAAYVAQSLGLGGQTPPSNEQRQRYGGVRGGEGANGGSTTTAAPVEMGKHQVALARALANREGKGASDAEAQEAWMKKVGTRIAGNRQG